MGRTFLMAMGLALASLFSAAPANAAFVLIDNFSGTNVGSRGTAFGGTYVFNDPGAPGMMSLDLVSGSFSQLNYTGIAAGALMPGTPTDDSTGVRLSNFTLTGATLGDFTVTAQYRDAGAGSFTAATSAVLDGTSLNFDFGTSLEDVEDLRFTFQNASAGTATFTANAIYAVPEPTTMALIGLASCGGLVGFRRKRNAAVA